MKRLATRTFDWLYNDGYTFTWANLVFDLLFLGMTVLSSLVFLRVVYRYWDRIW